jgi:hypothetical protein
MTSNPARSASNPSLVITFRYQPVCQKCIAIVSKWCSPIEEYTYGGFLGGWKIPDLMESSITCRCCRFLTQVLDASPWIRCTDTSSLEIRTSLVGSQHSSALERTWEDDHGQLQTGLEQPTSYQRYYRPQVSVESHYVSSNSTIILPAAPAEGASSAEHDKSHAFCGRVVEPQVNILLIKSWFQDCAASHHGHRGDGAEKPQISAVEEQGTSVRGCLPDLCDPILHFRLVDVSARCIVQVERQTDYAALSYVWGTAPRLILCQGNLDCLSQPGALSNDATEVPQTFRDAFEIVEKLFIRYIWIDALCIMQDNDEQLMNHMDAMDSIYGAAILTIVSDNESTSSGIAGWSLPRSPPQAIFRHAGVTYLSARRTFGEALRTSSWESRAWCLQEKIFSKRLLIFTDSQVFYHCGASTRFEDTITEPQENISGSVHMRERPNTHRKIHRDIVEPEYTAYESHRESFGRSFWSLIQAYSQRALSFEGDAIRAFSGILKSIAPQYGPALWGCPQHEFARGLSWALSEHRINLRREGFPSWSWAGWRGNAGVNLHFVNYKRKDVDIAVSEGRYRVSKPTIDGPSLFDLEWYYHVLDETTGEWKLKAIERGDACCDANVGQQHLLPDSTNNDAKEHFSHAAPPSTEKHVGGGSATRQSTWGIPKHPGENDALPVTAHMPLVHWIGMPPLQHIIRFYTSVANVLVEHNTSKRWHSHRLLVPGTTTCLQTLNLDPQWACEGKEYELIYISRWCHNWYMTEEIFEQNLKWPDENLNLMLVEGVEGWGGVKRRAHMLEHIKITDWRAANPRWELVSLA